MTGTLSRQIRKEVRVLGAGWLACMAAVAVMSISDQAPPSLALVAYLVGPIALGALSIGHEYNHRTLAYLLAQPVGRARVLAIKVGVLGVLLLALWAMAGWTAASGGRLDRGPVSGYVWAAWIFPILAGLCLAPWLTMLCRSALAGLVFAMATPAVIWMGAALVAVARFGVEGAQTPAADVFRLMILWTGMLATSLVGAVATWRMFVRLEAIDGRGNDVQLPAWLRRRAGAHASTRRPALVHLLLKELRLQQMTYVVSALFAAFWLLWPLIREALPTAVPTRWHAALAIAHGGFISLLAGSLASAEERQFGTREWHLTLPMAASLQWFVKAATAIGVALVLALGLPLALAALSPQVSTAPGRSADFPTAVMAVSILASGSLYVSSLSTSGVRAVIASIAAAPIAAPVVLWLINLTMTALWSLGAATSDPRLPAAPARWVGWLNGAIFVALLLRAGLANHRAPAVGWPTVVRQLLVVAGWVVLATVVAMVVG